METPPPALSPQPEQVPTDIELVAKTQSGDPTAFDQLIIRYQQRVYGVIYNMTSNHEDTNDLLMETFSKAFKNIHGYKGDSAFYTWIYRIAVNQTINFLKRNKAKSHLSLNNDENDLSNHPDLVDSTVTADVERQSRIGELQKKLNESLMKLSEKHRVVVTLFDIQGLSHAEIAKILGTTEGTVRSRLFYAHKQLRTYLEKYL